MTPEFETTVSNAIANDVLPGAVMLVRSRDGKLDYSHALGALSLSNPSSLGPLKPDSILTMASTTKLLTAIAVLQQVQAEKITLETDVSELLPELASLPVLSSSGNNPPVLSKRTEPILLKHLLTHSSGASYTWNSPDVVAHLTSNDKPVPVPLSPVGGKSVSERCSYPLTFQPGKGWVYGTGLDWAGLLVERLSGRKLDDYFQLRILQPLGIQKGEITFYPGRHPSLKGRRAGMTARGEKDRLRHHKLGEEPAENEAMGGEAGFGSMAAFVTVLADFLKPEGSKLLDVERQELLFKGCLSEESKAVLNQGLKGEGRDWIVGWVYEAGDGGAGARYDWSPAGLVTTEPGKEGKRKGGFVQWGGAFNLAWFIDREAGVCGVFATQILLPGDLKVRPLIKEFEEVVYSKL
ncbi:beta-lactamase/transpeptidase-like protein [Triangularia verruculosa]|uniref:Beta-lactamase/transpeptidase-like protein n=1 Tax=Triangularia verruculosa TaxID=2587418 RepID=A0AAN6XBZ3_9PEZI|nr:beta-lactamase/transpeptidase-like protein [Triangularia verruculosa]